MSDLLGSFLKSVRTKHVEKSCVGLWDQSLIMEVGKINCRGLRKGYQQRVLTNKDVEEVSSREV